MNILDLIIAVIFMVNILISFSRGITRSVINIFTIVLSLGATFFVIPSIALRLTEYSFYVHIYDFVYSKLGSIIDSVVFANSGDVSQSIIDAIGIPHFLQGFLGEQNAMAVSSLSEGAIQGVASSVETFQQSLANIITLLLVSLVLVFIIFAVIRWVMIFIYRRMFKNPFLGIKTLDKFIGGAVGIVQALLVVWTGISVLSILTMITGFDFKGLLNGSLLGTFFQENNPLEMLFLIVAKKMSWL